MLTQDGQLTDIGSWYLGGAATGNVPSSSSSSSPTGSGSTGVGYKPDSYNAVLRALAFSLAGLAFV